MLKRDRYFKIVFALLCFTGEAAVSLPEDDEVTTAANTILEAVVDCQDWSKEFIAAKCIQKH